MNARLPDFEELERTAHDDLLQVSLMVEPLHGDHPATPVRDLFAAVRKFYELRDFSHQVRFGSPHDDSIQALSELSYAQELLQRMTSETRGLNDQVVIEASLRVRLEPGSPGPA